MTYITDRNAATGRPNRQTDPHTHPLIAALRTPTARDRTNESTENAGVESAGARRLKEQIADVCVQNRSSSACVQQQQQQQQHSAPVKGNCPPGFYLHRHHSSDDDHVDGRACGGGRRRRVCRPCTACRPGVGAAKPCGRRADTVCVACVPGTTYADLTSYDQPCLRCTRCSRYADVERNCTPTHDASCQRCLRGTAPCACTFTGRYVPADTPAF